jgi:acylphosphatase
MSVIRRHWLFSGRVQGVGFRWTCVERARLLGLQGWVRNLPDGRVEALAEGPVGALDQLLHFLRGHPGAIHVDTVAEMPPSHDPLEPGFHARR